MRVTTLIAGLSTVLVVAAAEAQSRQAPDTAARRTAMERLHFLVGDWGGDVVSQTQAGQQSRHWQTEWVRYKLNGQVLALEGLGRRVLPTGAADTIFNAWASVDWTPERGYLMRTQTLNGRTGEVPLAVSDSGFSWGMKFPAGQVRYTMRLLPSGEWHERGEFSRDGVNWINNLEMRLKRASP